MNKIKIAFLTAAVGVGSIFVVGGPAKASCREYIEGRCLENDVCNATAKVTDKVGNGVDCIE